MGLRSSGVTTVEFGGVRQVKFAARVPDTFQMGTFKTLQIDKTQINTVQLQNVSLIIDGLDPVLNHVDFELPLDQNIFIKSTNPNHGLQFLQILAGHQKPQSGCIKWNEKDIFSDEVTEFVPHQMMGCYFENWRPDPRKTVFEILREAGQSTPRINEILEQFEITKWVNKKFGDMVYELQKTVHLISVISREPQMLILEDPAMGLSEAKFLEILDLIQYGQRRGNLRHIYFTNHHPTALRHWDSATLHLEDGLIYFEEKSDMKKVFNF